MKSLSITMKNMNEQSKNRISLTWVLVLVAAFACFFAGTKSLGAYGFMFGVFVIMIALGGMTDRDRLKIAGGVGLVTLVGIVLVAWWNFGTRGQMDNAIQSDVQAIRQAEPYLANLYELNGRYPKSLYDAVYETQSVNSWEMNRFLLPTDWYHYQTDGEAYELKWLGADRELGGVGVNRDIDIHNCGEVADERLPFRQFLFDTPGSSGMGVAIMLSFLASGGMLSGTSGRGGTWKGVLLNSLICGGVAFLLGTAMAGFHIAASQSNH
jgi:hypothetical protein